jgi:hypothetical protein
MKVAFHPHKGEKHSAYVAEAAQHDFDLWMSDVTFTDFRRLTGLKIQ